MNRRQRVRLRQVLVVLLGAVSSWGCNAPAPPAASVEIALPDMTGMESQVAARLTQLAEGIRLNPDSAEAWGRLGMVLHAHELLAEAEPAYARAREIDPEEARWAFYHGDVLSLSGTDLDGAESAFRSFLDARPDYAAGHMRLGKVLIAINRPDEAVAALERALELAPDLQPARVALAQVRLAEGRLEEAEELLQEVLSAAPRHEQALTTLSQVYMRQGRRDEARQAAEQSGDAAAYNLYSDPLMGQVVAEEISSVQIWERAKGFLDNGNFEQAAIGLARVVELTPDNADAHLQLAVALGHLDQPATALTHLERSVQLQPDSTDARVRLGALYLQLRRPDAAVPHLRAAISTQPQNTEARWSLGRALLQIGQPAAAVEVFANIESQGLAMPDDARVDWGNALAQVGNTEGAFARFEEVLERNPNHPQALFFAGLLRDGQGDRGLATSLYCRSLAADPGSPAAQRLAAIGSTCT